MGTYGPALPYNIERLYIEIIVYTTIKHDTKILYRPNLLLVPIVQFIPGLFTLIPLRMVNARAKLASSISMKN